MLAWESEKQNCKKEERMIPFSTKFSRACDRFFLSKYFFLFLFTLACFITVTENEIVGATVFICIICIALLLCDDVLATTLPFLLLCVFVTSCYDSFDSFSKYFIIALPAIASLVFHFLVYRHTKILGSTFGGLIAVSIALIFGGFGFITVEEYLSLEAVYHVLFLGVGMIVAYILLKPELCAARNYCVRTKFISLLYIMGMFACFFTLWFIIQNIDYVIEKHSLPYFQPSNNISTMIMFALPCPFFFAERKLPHILSSFAMLACIFLTGSRGGILFGSIEFIICLIAFSIWDKRNRFLYICLTVFLCGAAFAILGEILVFGDNQLLPSIISKDEARYKLIERAKALFRENPVFGHGLGYKGNSDLYDPVKGAMGWYHMMIPQIIGSMGVIGILAYGYQLWLRGRSAFFIIKNTHGVDKGTYITLFLSYIGVLLMSQVNPGLFCPLPYSLLAVMIFAMMD